MTQTTKVLRTHVDSEWMTLTEFAALLGISTTFAYEKARSNSLPVPAIRVGRQFRFSRKAYEELTHSQHSLTSQTA